MTEETTIENETMKVQEEIKPTGESRQIERRVQCADCLAWLSPDVNHTCRQMVRRNQRNAK